METSVVVDYIMDQFQNMWKKIDIKEVVNINGIERKIYSVAAAAQFPHHALMKVG